MKFPEYARHVVPGDMSKVNGLVRQEPLVGLCGKRWVPGGYDAYFDVKDFVSLVELGLEVCEDCLNHPDLPLVILAELGEEEK